jgi:hypothetical protein
MNQSDYWRISFALSQQKDEIDRYIQSLGTFKQRLIESTTHLDATDEQIELIKRIEKYMSRFLDFLLNLADNISKWRMFQDTLGMEDMPFPTEYVNELRERGMYQCMVLHIPLWFFMPEDIRYANKTFCLIQNHALGEMVRRDDKYNRRCAQSQWALWGMTYISRSVDKIVKGYEVPDIRSLVKSAQYITQNTAQIKKDFATLRRLRHTSDMWRQIYDIVLNLSNRYIPLVEEPMNLT